MIPDQPEVEHWRCNENREEEHYYAPGTQIYLFGVNPAVIPPSLVRLLLKAAQAYLTRQGKWG